MPTKRQLGAVEAIPLTVLLLGVVFALQMMRLNTGLDDSLATDDVMRLVGVRDLIAGQSWFDLHQYRLNPPGVLMHWSRLVDAPLALVVVVLTPLLGATGAEHVMLVVWPLLLLALALVLVAAVAKELTGSIAVSLAATALALLAKPVLLHFRPGAIDHHNVQMVLLLTLLLFALRVGKSRISAVIAAMAASSSLAVGVEMLPTVAAICVVIAGCFVWRGAAGAGETGAFGLALAASSLVLALALLPFNAMLAPVCDAFGGPVLLLTIGGGAGLAAMAAINRHTALTARATSSVVIGICLIAMFATKFRQCVTSPYGHLDALVANMWLDKVQETVSLARMLKLAPEEVLGFYGLPIITLVLSCVAWVRCDPLLRDRWAICCAALATALAVSVWQLRGTPGANLMAAPLFVAAAATIWPSLATGRALALLALAVSPATLAISGALAKPLTDTVFKPDTTIVNPSQCTRMSAAAPLQDLPRGLIAAPIDLSPTILAQTSHSVIAAPFHRNVDGNGALLRLMVTTPQQAYRMLVDRKIDYVVTCRATPDRQFIDLAPDGLEAVLARGETPGFLAPIDLGPHANIAAWRVMR